MMRTNMMLLGASFLVCASGAAMGQSGPVSAEHSRSVIIVRQPVSRDCNFAGTLIINCREFRITTDCPITEQIERAFEAMDFDASCRGGRVRVSLGNERPEVRWIDGEYCLETERCDGRLFVTPVRHVITEPEYRADYRGRARDSRGQGRSGSHAEIAVYHPDRPGSDGGIKAALKVKINTGDRW